MDVRNHAYAPFRSSVLRSSVGRNEVVVPSKAKGSEKLQQTLMQLFMGDGAAGMIPGGFNMGNIGKKMQIFAMAM